MNYQGSPKYKKTKYRKMIYVKNNINSCFKGRHQAYLVSYYIITVFNILNKEEKIFFSGLKALGNT